MKKCQCELCEGNYIQVDPIGCGCTECIVGEYRPAKDENDYKKHQELFCLCEHVSGDNNKCTKHNEDY